jgi:hypothetical protein
MALMCRPPTSPTATEIEMHEDDLTRPETAYDQLIDLLRAAYQDAASPPLRHLERRMRIASYSTLSRLLNGRIKRPTWNLVRPLLDELGAHDRVDEARELWMRARTQMRPATNWDRDPEPAEPVQLRPEPPSTIAQPAAVDEPSGVCEVCGVGNVVNMDRHLAWHWTLEQQLRRALIRPVSGGTESAS